MLKVYAKPFTDVTPVSRKVSFQNPFAMLNAMQGYFFSKIFFVWPVKDWQCVSFALALFIFVMFHFVVKCILIVGKFWSIWFSFNINWYLDNLLRHGNVGWIWHMLLLHGLIKLYTGLTSGASDESARGQHRDTSGSDADANWSSFPVVCGPEQDQTIFAMWKCMDYCNIWVPSLSCPLLCSVFVFVLS